MLPTADPPRPPLPPFPVPVLMDGEPSPDYPSPPPTVNEDMGVYEEEIIPVTAYPMPPKGTEKKEFL